MHQNSLDSYNKAVKPHIAGTRKKVYDVIRQKKAVTAKEIAVTLGWGINCVTPRICELRKMRAIIEAGSVKNGLGINVSLYAPIDKNHGGIV